MSEISRIILDSSKICRTCLEQKSLEELTPLSENNYLNLVSKVANLQLSLTPTLPKNICDACLKNLNIALNFIKQIHNCESRLENILLTKNSNSVTVIYKTFNLLPNNEISKENINEFIGEQVELQNDNIWLVKDDESCDKDTENIYITEEISSDNHELNNAESDELNLTSTETNVIKWANSKPHLNNNDNESRIKRVKQKKIANFNCDLCSKTFRFEFIYKKHLLKHGIPLECELCQQQQFQDVNNYLIHIKTNHKSYKLFTCPTCKQRFYSLSSLKAHYQRHIPERPKKFTCDICGKMFAQHNSLTIHKKFHTSRVPYTCDICNKKLSGSHSLRNHLKIHKGEKKHKCNICGATFIHGFSLTAHLRIHTGEKPFACNICNSKFSTSSYLKIHIRTHTSEKPYKCNWCKKQFVSRCSLTAHEKAHTGEKKYQCDYCGWRSARFADLQTHIRKHTGEKPYNCDQCQKRYKTASNLAYHKKTHLGLKEFVCTTCNKAFGDPRTLKSHIRIHTGEMPYQCHVCGQRFKQSGQLSTHRKRHESMEILDNT